MKRKITWFLFFLIASSISFAQFGGPGVAKKTDLKENLPIDNKVKIGKLENGLVYYIRENKKPENRIQFQLVVNAGSILESKNQLGLAHFVEHMAFNGTKHYKGNQMIDELEKKGIVFGRGINAYTGFDQTVYYVVLPNDSPELIDMGFKILDGWAFGLLLEGNEIEKERGVIIEEWRGRLGASDRIRKATWPVMLKGSLYADRLPIGTEESIRTFKHDTLKQFYYDWYRTDNMALVIVGDFKAAEMEKKIKEYYSDYKPVENPRKREQFGIPGNKEPLVVVATDPEETQTALSFLWKLPRLHIRTGEDFRKNLAIDIMDDMLNARISEKSDKADCPFLYSGIGYSPSFFSPELDAYYGYCVPKDNQIAASFESVLSEIYRADQNGFLSTEFERTKEDVLERYEKAAKEEGKVESTRLASEYGDNFLNGSPIMSAKQELKYAQECIDNITLDEINTFIRDFITEENFVISLTAPQKDGLTIPTEKELLAIVNKVQKMKFEPYVDNYKEEPLLSETLPEGNISKTVENKEFGFTEYTLSNGVRFVLKPTDFKNDEILIRAWSPGGNSLYPDAMFYTSTLSANLINMSGLGNFDNSQMQKKLKGKNCNISPIINELSEGVSGYSSPKDMETALQMNHLYFKAPRKDAEAFEKLTSSIKTQIKFIRSNPQVAFQEALFETCYPENKRTVLIPTDEIINSVKLDDVFSIYQDRFADASDFVYVFVGNFGIDTTAPLIAKYLGNLPNLGRKENFIDRSTPFAKGKVERTVEKGTDNVGQMAILNEKSFDWNDKDRLTMNVLSQCIEITMTEIIREELGGTYSPQAGIQVEKYPEPTSGFYFIIGCDPTNTTKLSKAAFNILAKYQKKGGDQKTLDKVKEQMKREREKQLKENNFWLSSLLNSYSLGTDINSISTFNERLDAITLADLKTMAQKYLPSKEYVQIMLKPENKKK